MRRAHCILFALLTQSIACEFIPSAYPFYGEEDITFDPRILGKWRATDSNDVFLFEFGKQCDGARDIYELTLEFEGKPDSAAEFDARLFALGERRYLDAVLDQEPNNFGELLLIQGHALARVDVDAERFSIALANGSWLESYLSQHPASLAHARGRETFLVADTNALQQFILAHQGEGELFDESAELTRVADVAPGEPVISCRPGPIAGPEFEVAIRALVPASEAIVLASLAHVAPAQSEPKGVLVATRESLLLAGWDLRSNRYRELHRNAWSEFACAEPRGDSITLYAPFPDSKKLDLQLLDPTTGQPDSNSVGPALKAVRSRLATEDARCPLIEGSAPLAETRAGLVLPGRAGDGLRVRAFRHETGLTATYGNLQLRLIRKGSLIRNIDEEVAHWSMTFGAGSVSERSSESLKVGGSVHSAVVLRLHSVGGAVRTHTRIDLGDWLLVVVEDGTATLERTRELLGNIEFTADPAGTTSAP